jgi:hypothetical protein
MLLGAALRAGTGLQGWGAENATPHRRLQLGKGGAPSRSALEPLLSKEEVGHPLLQSMHGLRDSQQIRDGGPRHPSLRWGSDRYPKAEGQWDTHRAASARGEAIGARYEFSIKWKRK